MYFFERPADYDALGVYTLTKLEAATGTFVWRSIIFYGIQFCQPVVMGDYIYVFLEPSEILCFGKETGELSATARVDIENKNLSMKWNGVGYGNHLYLSLYNETSVYFTRLNVNSIERSGNPEIVQLITPEILWEPETKMGVTAKPAVYNNVVYTGTYGSTYYGGIALAGFDIDSTKRVFNAKLGIDKNVV